MVYNLTYNAVEEADPIYITVTNASLDTNTVFYVFPSLFPQRQHLVTVIRVHNTLSYQLDNLQLSFVASSVNAHFISLTIDQNQTVEIVFPYGRRMTASNTLNLRSISQPIGGGGGLNFTIFTKKVDVKNPIPLRNLQGFLGVVPSSTYSITKYTVPVGKFTEIKYMRLYNVNRTTTLDGGIAIFNGVDIIPIFRYNLAPLTFEEVEFEYPIILNAGDEVRYIAPTSASDLYLSTFGEEKDV